eukprot:Opistho-1_new@47430
MAEPEQTPGNPAFARRQSATDLGLLDLAWERQQQKTFTAWCNAQLAKTGVKITNITEDFRDGTNLIKLLEIIANEKLPKAETGKLRVHKIQNINKALQFIKDKGVKLIGIGAEEICDGNLKLTLGMIWTIILRYQIQDITVEELSAKEGLLLWCQKKTKGYKNVNVQNFHMSFKDGLAFCALIHRHRPELLDYDSLKKGPEDALHNLNLAFDVAEKHIGIPKLLDAEDIVNTPKPDERSIMTQVAAYYHAFASSQKAEIAARRIGKILDFASENDKLIQEYENLVSDLLGWIQSTIARLQNAQIGNTTSAVQEVLGAFRIYRKAEKPPRAEQKSALEAQYSTIQTKLRANNRAAYMPAEGRMVSDIDAAWRDLDTAERQYDEKIREQLIRLEKLELLAAKFNQKADIHQSWTSGKDALLMSTDVGDSLASVIALRKQHDAFLSDMSAHESRVITVQGIAQELVQEGYHSADAVQARSQAIKDEWCRLLDLASDRTTKLIESEKRQIWLDELRLDFAKKAASFNSWSETALEDLTDAIKVFNESELQKIRNEHAAFKNAIGGPQASYDELLALDTQLANEGVTSNPYTTLTRASIEAKWAQILQSVSDRDAAIENEAARQQANEALRVRFAQAANEFGAWMGGQKAIVAKGFTGKSEEQLAALSNQEQTILARGGDFDAIDNLSHEVEEALIFENRHSNYSMESLRSEWDSLKSLIRRYINDMQNQILARDMSGISEETLQEYRQSFSHFDKDKSGSLDRLEFRSALLSLGFSLPDIKPGEADTEFERILAQVDPGHTGRVQFDAFVDFMRKENADADSPEQLIESFRVLAGDKAYITEDDMRRELTPAQVAYCLARMQPHSGAPNAYDYQSFTKQVYG